VRRICLALTLVLALASPAAASAQTYTPVRGSGGPGPSNLNRSYVLKIGPSAARRVLVLIPGTYGGAGDFRLVARDIVKRVPDLQVWAWDRRTQGLEDTAVFASGDAERAFGYYLNGQAVDGRTFTPVDGPRDAPYARDWGLAVQLGDLRNVIKAARAGGRKVILGGHSLGGAMAMAYASWDFDGIGGYRDLAGLVLIDGALDPGAKPMTLTQARGQKKAIDTGDPFADLLGVGLPWAPGVFAETGALYARTAPSAASALQGYPLLPSYFRAPFPLTNEAALGYALDQRYAPPALALITVRSGRLASSGDPRGWIDAGNSPIQRVAELFSTEPANAVEWYFPRRLTLDVQAASALRRTPATQLLGLRVIDSRKVDVPLFAFGTDFSNGRVVKAARRFVVMSRIPRASFAQADHFTHLDPLTASPGENHLLTTVVPFLESIR
jgi:pimeloyl-ACP methyl ester carboxylesterase